MRRIASNPIFWGAIAVASLVLHFWWAWTSGKGEPVARGGAVWVIIGVILAARPVIRRRGGFQVWLADSRASDLGRIVPTPEQVEAGWQSDLDAYCIQIAGPMLALLGTLIWAYGDIPTQWAIGVLKSTAS